jgi:hypothetical protein
MLTVMMAQLQLLPPSGLGAPVRSWPSSLPLELHEKSLQAFIAVLPHCLTLRKVSKQVLQLLQVLRKVM